MKLRVFCLPFSKWAVGSVCSMGTFFFFFVWVNFSFVENEVGKVFKSNATEKSPQDF